MAEEPPNEYLQADQSLETSFSDLAVSPTEFPLPHNNYPDDDIPQTSWPDPYDTHYPYQPPIDPELYGAQAQDSNIYDPTYASSSTQPVYHDDNASSAATTCLFHCSECGEGFSRQCDLTKHTHKHSKRRKCHIYGCEWQGGAETKDLNRHLWANHREYARDNNIPKDDKVCGWNGCDYHGRGDNLKRHKDKKGHW